MKIKKDGRVESKKQNKKGFELTISTLVVIVLGVVLLIALVLGFTLGWQNFWLTIKGYFSSDVSKTIQACQTVCQMQNAYDFCCLQRELKFNNTAKIEKINCTDERLKVECDINCKDVC